MKKLFKQLLPVLMGAAAVGCSTVDESQVNQPQFSEKQLAFQKMIKEQEAVQIEQLKQTFIDRANAKINASIDVIAAANAGQEALKAEKMAKKKEIIVATKKLVDAEKKKLADTTFQDQYWKFVEEGKELEASQPEEPCPFNPVNWFASKEEMTAEEAEMAEFTAEEYKIALKINKDNQETSSKSYEALKLIVVSNTQAIVDQCKKELAAIDKEIADAEVATANKIAAENKKIALEEELVTYYSSLEVPVMEEEVVEEAPAAE